MYIVLYVRTESLNHFSCISNIFHWMSFTFMVPNVQNVQENLNLWQTKWKQMELSPFISANFVHLFLVFKPTIVKHCIQFFVWELIISLLLDQKLKAASFSFGTSECWTVELEFKRSLKLKGSKTLDCSSSNVEREIV